MIMTDTSKIMLQNYSHLVGGSIVRKRRSHNYIVSNYKLTWAREDVVPATSAFLCSLVRWCDMTGLILAPASLDRRELPGLIGSHGEARLGRPAPAPDTADI